MSNKRGKMDYQQRIKTVQQQLQELGCDAFIVEDPINLYYLLGLKISSGRLLLLKNQAYLFVDGRYTEICEKANLVSVIPTKTEENTFHNVLQKEAKEVKRLGFSSELLSYKMYLDLSRSIQEMGRTIELVTLDNPIKKIRSIKDQDELKLLKDAAELGSKGYDFLLEHLKEGVTEVELARDLEIFWKQQGSKSLAFEPIIAFGANSSMPHYRSSDIPLKKGDTVLLDIGVNLQGYHSDMTRTVFFQEPLSVMKEIYAIVKQAQEKALEIIKPGIEIVQLDRAARGYIEETGYGPYFSHGLGHGVGLEIHELPSLRKPFAIPAVCLEEGMVITIEPGIYLPNIGGVRIENTVAVTNSGYEDLTKRSTEMHIIS